MDILGTLLNDKGSELLSGLVSSGFSQEQADKFLPEAGSSVMSLLGEGDLDIAAILEKIDIAALAEKVGIDSSLAQAGLEKILPMLMEQLGGSDLGNIMGKMKSLF